MGGVAVARARAVAESHRRLLVDSRAGARKSQTGSAAWVRAAPRQDLAAGRNRDMSACGRPVLSCRCLGGRRVRPQEEYDAISGFSNWQLLLLWGSTIAAVGPPSCRPCRSPLRLSLVCERPGKRHFLLAEIEPDISTLCACPPLLGTTWHANSGRWATSSLWRKPPTAHSSSFLTVAASSRRAYARARVPAHFRSFLLHLFGLAIVSVLRGSESYNSAFKGSKAACNARRLESPPPVSRDSEDRHSPISKNPRPPVHYIPACRRS